jgi:hypothetical protein
VGPALGGHNSPFFVLGCVGGKDIISQCATHKIRNLSVSSTNPSFEDVLETIFLISSQLVKRQKRCRRRRKLTGGSGFSPFFCSDVLEAKT